MGTSRPEPTTTRARVARPRDLPRGDVAAATRALPVHLGGVPRRPLGGGAAGARRSAAGEYGLALQVVCASRLLDADCRTIEEIRLVNAVCRFAELAEAP